MTETHSEDSPDDDGAPSQRLRLAWGGATHAGRVRTVNQDALFADQGLFVVADGMGGHQGGEVASKIAVRSMVGSEHSSLDELVSSVESANAAVWEYAEKNPELKGMGTTVTAIAVVGGGRPPRLGLANVGDSRIYRWRDGTLDQLTHDHSYVAELVRRGQLDDEEAETHPYRNMLTRAIGVAETVDVDSWELTPEPGDRFILCSDGLVNEVTDPVINTIVGREDDPSESARMLIDQANTGGGRDNITVVIVHVDAEVGAEPLDAPEPATAPTSVDTGVFMPVSAADPTVEMEAVEVDSDAGPALFDDAVHDDGAVQGPDAAAAELDETESDEIEPAEAESDEAELDEAELALPDASEGIDQATVATADDLFSAPVDDDDLPVVTERRDPLAGFELPSMDDDETLPWLADDGAGAGSDETEPESVEPDDVEFALEPDDHAGEAPVPLVRNPAEDTAVVKPIVDDPVPPDAVSVDEPDNALRASDQPSEERLDESEPGEPTDEQEAEPTVRIVDLTSATTVGPEPSGWSAPVHITLRTIAAVVLVLGVLAAAVGLTGWYARSSYHVGFAGDEVVIFQGRPGGVFWFDPTLEEGSGVFRSDLPAGTVEEVDAIVEVSSLEAARAFVEEIRPADSAGGVDLQTGS